MKIDLYHNIRWSRYKARVFSALHRSTDGGPVEVRFFQIADTDGERASLSSVALDYHQYPHELLFPGAYDKLPVRTLVSELFKRVFCSDADLVLIPGFSRPEHWAMLLAAVLTGKKRGTFCDSTLQDRPQTKLKGILKRLFFRCCHGVFCYGERAREYLLHYGVPEARIHKRYQAAALPNDYSPEAARAVRLRIAASGAAPLFLYVGRLSAEKGLETLLAAFAAVHRRIPAARLVLVGGGALAGALKVQAEALSLKGVVEFAGGMEQQGLAEQYARASCLVLPSRSEPWGLVVNEALHYGCPVVVSQRCGCVPELVQEGVSGYSFRCDDVDDLVTRLLQLLRDFTDVDQAAERCLRLIAPFSPDVAAKQMLLGSQMIMQEGRKCGF